VMLLQPHQTDRFNFQDHQLFFEKNGFEIPVMVQNLKNKGRTTSAAQPVRESGIDHYRNSVLASLGGHTLCHFCVTVTLTVVV
jgi:hypothetical protein